MWCRNRGDNSDLKQHKAITGVEGHDRKIEDVVIDAASGQIVYTVLSFGGFLGLGESWVVMPWHSLQTMHRGQTFTLNMSEEQLKNAPKFDPNQWPDMEDLHWGDTIHAYYGQVPYWRQQLPPTAAHEKAESPQFQLLRSDQALRQEVINTRGQRIGKNEDSSQQATRYPKEKGSEPARSKLRGIAPKEIEDIVIDATLERIAYAVLSFGGFLELGEKWFAVPWSAFEPSPGFRTLTLDVSKEALKKAPGFDKNDWPEMADRSWATAIHDAFGQPLYWDRHKGANKAPEAGDKAPHRRQSNDKSSRRVAFTSDTLSLRSVHFCRLFRRETGDADVAADTPPVRIDVSNSFRAILAAFARSRPSRPSELRVTRLHLRSLHVTTCCFAHAPKEHGVGGPHRCQNTTT